MLAYEVEGYEARTYRKLAELLKLIKPLIIFDVETTGQFAHRDRIIQIGYIKIFPLGQAIAGQIDLNPEIKIPVAATAVHHITDFDVQGKPRFREVIPELQRIFDENDVSGFNVKFDIGFMEAEFKRNNANFNIGLAIDAWQIFITYNPRDLTAAVKHYLSEDLSNAHNALADTRATARVLAKQREVYSDFNNMGVQEIHDMFNKPPEGYVDAQRKLVLRGDEVLLNFGKHAGLPLKDVPIEYRKWIVGKGDFSETVKNAIKVSLK